MKFIPKGRLGFQNCRPNALLKPSIPKYPGDGWGKSLERMPPFTRAEMNQHIESSGKRVGNADHHSIPTNFRKVKTFLKDKYLKDVEANSDLRYFYLTTKCYNSFRKKDAPPSLPFELCTMSGQVLHANCSYVKLETWLLQPRSCLNV